MKMRDFSAAAAKKDASFPLFLFFSSPPDFGGDETLRSNFTAVVVSIATCLGWQEPRGLSTHPQNAWELGWRVCIGKVSCFVENSE